MKSYSGPWVIKPSNSSGQRGISYFNDTSNLEKLFHDAIAYATDNKAIIEQFLEGPEINVCAVVSDGHVKFLSVADRVTIPDKNFGIAISHVYPSLLNTAQIEKVKNVSQKAIKAIGLTNGIAYPQFIVNQNGAWVMEIAARMPGGNNREVALYTSGIDMVKVAVNQAMGIKPDFNDKDAETFPATTVRFITRNDIPETIESISSVDGIENARQLPNVKEVFMYLKEGQKIPDLKNSTARFGGIIAVGNERNTAIATAEKAFKMIQIK